MAVKIGVVQLQVNADKSANFDCAKSNILKAVGNGAKMVFLPECFDFICPDRQLTLAQSETLHGNVISEYKKLASDCNVWLSMGGQHRKTDDDTEDERIFNTHLLIDNTGQIAATYDKVHLFDVKVDVSSEDGQNSTGISMMESRTIRPGSNLPPVVQNTPIGAVGLAICYDMRFPELASHLRYAGGAHVLTYPSAFSVPTGRAGHWHTLLRARAIENQCYVIAAAQEGAHHAKRSSYGHSLVIDPWGRTLAERVEPGPGLLMCDILPYSNDSEPSPLAKVRQSIPVANHRRMDLFPMQDCGHRRVIGSADYMFGPKTITASCVFYRSALSFAFVNISPLVPGHVLVCPVTCVSRFHDLSEGQVADLYLTVKKVTAPLATYFAASSLTISIQDGIDAGQSIPHVHVHVLPRKPGDFDQNHHIYLALQQHDKVANRVYRTLDVMVAEANGFRRLFYPME